MTRKPVVWSIAGSDCGAGAGLQADLKAFEAMDVHGCTAVAAITAQNSQRVSHVEPVRAELLDAQLAALAEDMRPAAIKTGLLGSVENLRVVARWVDLLGVPLVVDPVLGASTGKTFVDDALLEAYRRELLPRAALVTPNRHEAARLLTCGDFPNIAAQAKALLALGCAAVVVTGGDVGDQGYEEPVRDYLHSAQYQGWMELPRVATRHNHGTGCVFAAAAAAAMALDYVPAEAAIIAKMLTVDALKNGYEAGLGPGPVRPMPGFAMQANGLPNLPCDASPGAFARLDDERIGLYAVVDSADWVQRVLAAGVRTVQLRIKSADKMLLRNEVRRCVEMTRAAGAQFFVNDDWQLAIETGAYGVHLGQEDVDSADLQAISQAGLRLGLSTHSLWEVCRAQALRPSYMACGPIYPTQLKRMPWAAQGELNLAFWCQALQGLPVVAIGGMDAPRARGAIQCGAAGVAVVSAITAAADPEQAVAALRRSIQDAQFGQAMDRVPANLPRPAYPG